MSLSNGREWGSISGIYPANDGDSIWTLGTPGRPGEAPERFTRPNDVVAPRMARFFWPKVTEWSHPTEFFVSALIAASRVHSARPVMARASFTNPTMGQRNAGWERGVRVGDARTGSVFYFITGSWNQPTINEMSFSGPGGVAVDRHGNIYAAEVFQRRVIKYTRIQPACDLRR